MTANLVETLVVTKREHRTDAANDARE